MFAYIVRRLALMVPTILGIMLISFVIIQFAPGGPVERIIAQLQGADGGVASRIGGGGGDPGSLGAVTAAVRAIAARRDSTPPSSRISKSSSASTNRLTNASSR